MNHVRACVRAYVCVRMCTCVNAYIRATVMRAYVCLRIVACPETYPQAYVCLLSKREQHVYEVPFTWAIIQRVTRAADRRRSFAS